MEISQYHLDFYPEYDLLPVACANHVGGVVCSPVLGPPRSCEIQPHVGPCEWGGELEAAPWAADKSADACCFHTCLLDTQAPVSKAGQAAR